MKSNLHGFTLMELLIVIGVLGILVAGLLAAIDPFEQLKKARDTNTRNATIELLQSLQRFYTTHGELPWNMAQYSAVCGTGAGESLDGFGDILDSAMSIQYEPMAECLEASLVMDGELKETFVAGTGGSHIYIGSNLADKSDVTVCFEPKSKTNMTDYATIYLVNTIGGNRYSIVEQTGVAPLNACTRLVGDCAQCFR